MNNRLTLAASLLALSAFGFAAEKTFTVVGDRLEYRNLATVVSESEFEAFTGKTTKVSGSLTFDMAKKTGSGTIMVDVASIQTGIPTRDEHMRSAQWLDAEKFPSIKFETKSVKSAGGDKYRVTGNLTLHGVTKTITINATVKYRAASPAVKSAGFDGDVVQIATKFDIKLSDYGVTIPAPAQGKVSNEVTLGISAYATAK